MDPSTFGERLLVIAPHPDDEVIAAGGTIARAVDGGACVRVVVVTAGDGYRRAATKLAGHRADAAAFRQLAEARRRESIAGLAVLGVHQDAIDFLGYGDGTLVALWEGSWDQPHPNSRVDGATASPYDFAYRRAAPYRGRGVVEDLASIVRDFVPTAVLMPDPNDTHADHRATGALCEYALNDLGFSGGRFTFITHFGHYPFPWLYGPDLRLDPPSRLSEVGTLWHAVELRQEDEAAKRAAIDRYGTQVAVADLRLFMLASVRRNEVFGSFKPVALPPDLTATGSSVAGLGVTLSEPPPMPMARFVPGRPRIGHVRLVRTESSLWIGLACDSNRADLRFGFHLRLFGGGAAGRFDAVVRDGVTQVGAAFADSLPAKGATGTTSGPTAWLEVPAALLAGRTCAMVGADVRRASGGYVYRTAWRTLTL